MLRCNGSFTSSEVYNHYLIIPGGFPGFSCVVFWYAEGLNDDMPELGYDTVGKENITCQIFKEFKWLFNIENTTKFGMFVCLFVCLFVCVFVYLFALLVFRPADEKAKLRK